MKLHDGKIYTQYETDLWSGDILLPVETVAPKMGWKGGRISEEEWRKIVAFMLWTNTEFKSEGLIQLFYNEERGIFGYPPPQTVGTGMTVTQRSTKEDWDEYDAIHRIHIGDAEPIGSVHHHCNGGAFQSGVDKEDELKKVGLHITLGNMDKLLLAFHSRLSFRKNFYEPNLLEWFELPEWMDNIRKPSILKELVLDMLCQVPEDRSFPELWKEPCHLKPPVVVNNTYSSTSLIKPAVTYPGYQNQYDAFDELEQLYRDYNVTTDDGISVVEITDIMEFCYAYEASVKRAITNMPEIRFKLEVHNKEHQEVLSDAKEDLDLISYNEDAEIYIENVSSIFDRVLDQAIDVYAMYVKDDGRWSQNANTWGGYIDKIITGASYFDPRSGLDWCSRSQIKDRWELERLLNKLEPLIEKSIEESKDVTDVAVREKVNA